MRGKPTSELKVVGKTDRRGTQITFLPDLEIFETIEYDDTVLTQRFRETAFLTRGLKIDFADNRGEGEKHSFQYDGGIVDFVHYLHSQGTRSPLSKKVAYIHDESDVGEVEVALEGDRRDATLRSQTRGQRRLPAEPARRHDGAIDRTALRVEGHRRAPLTSARLMTGFAAATAARDRGPRAAR